MDASLPHSPSTRHWGEFTEYTVIPNCVVRNRSTPRSSTTVTCRRKHVCVPVSLSTRSCPGPAVPAAPSSSAESPPKQAHGWVCVTVCATHACCSKDLDDTSYRVARRNAWAQSGCPRCPSVLRVPRQSRNELVSLSSTMSGSCSTTCLSKHASNKLARVTYYRTKNKFPLSAHPGPIPAWLGDMKTLRTLWLSNNNFSGE